jgi:hypothetical protein
MGGFGTFEALYKYPEKFAAAMVLCGGGSPSTAAEVMKTPLWIFHGGEDNEVPIAQSLNLYNQMIALGATKVRFTEYPTASHDMWDYAPKEPAWPDWIFIFSKGDTFAQRPDVSISLSCTKRITNYTEVIVTWNNVDNRQIRQNKIWYYKIIRNDSVIVTPDFSQTAYYDRVPINGLNVYKMTAVNYDFWGSDSSNTVTVDNTTGVIENENSFPQEFVLSQNYPNPCNPSTTISFTLPSRSFVTLKIFDLLGREVSTIVSGELQAGSYTRQWNAANMASGVYFYGLTAGSFVETKKLILLK